MLEEYIRELVAQYFKATRDGNVDEWLDTFAQDAVAHDPVHGPPTEGHEALRKLFEGSPPIGLTEEFVLVEGNKVAVKWKGRERHGQKVICEGIDIFEVKIECKIQTQWACQHPETVVTAKQ